MMDTAIMCIFQMYRAVMHIIVACHHSCLLACTLHLAATLPSLHVYSPIHSPLIQGVQGSHIRGGGSSLNKVGWGRWARFSSCVHENVYYTKYAHIT